MLQPFDLLDRLIEVLPDRAGQRRLLSAPLLVFKLGLSQGVIVRDLSGVDEDVSLR